jgi:hypothetical protein
MADDQTSHEGAMRVRTPRAYKLCDGVTEAVIHFMVVFTPWAFGTTQQWSIWTMNVSAYLLGGLLLAKWLIRWKTGYVPARWGRNDEALGETRPAEGMEDGGWKMEDGGEDAEAGNKAKDPKKEKGQKSEIRDQRPGSKGLMIARMMTGLLTILTVFILLYCLTSALNARATFDTGTNSFEYHDYISWLPHTYDKDSTWQAFWSYLGLALFFWATRDWILGKTSRERRGSSESREESEYPPSIRHSSSSSFSIPARLRRLLWVLCVNGGLVALEGILQRLDGTGKLLWLIEPRFNKTAEAQFGPYAYRSNAAAYINLVWPICLGFWLALRKASARRGPVSRRVGGGSHALLLPCAVVMAASPIFSTSRGGAIVAVGQILAGTVILFLATKREGTLLRSGALSVFIFTLGLTAYLGWQQLQERLENVFTDNLSNRTEIYENAQQIAADFPLLGTGAGSFGTIYFLYKNAPQTWEAYLHDDWLETRITFGWLGLSAILIMLGITVIRWFNPTGIHMPWEFVSFLWLGVGGCLVHAKFDFPFQIYSITFLFLLYCSILFCISRRVRQ